MAKTLHTDQRKIHTISRESHEAHPLVQRSLSQRDSSLQHSGLIRVEVFASRRACVGSSGSSRHMEEIADTELSLWHLLSTVPVHSRRRFAMLDSSTRSWEGMTHSMRRVSPKIIGSIRRYGREKISQVYESESHMNTSSKGSMHESVTPSTQVSRHSVHSALR